MLPTPSLAPSSSPSAVPSSKFLLGRYGPSTAASTAGDPAPPCSSPVNSQPPVLSMPRFMCLADAIDEGQKFGLSKVFDPAIGRWEEVAANVHGRLVLMSQVADGKIYTVIRHGPRETGGYVYDPQERVWDAVGGRFWLGVNKKECVVDGVLYSSDSGQIKGIDVRQLRDEASAWKELKGLEDEGLSRFWDIGARLANVGGKLLLVW